MKTRTAYLLAMLGRLHGKYESRRFLASYHRACRSAHGARSWRSLLVNLEAMGRGE